MIVCDRYAGIWWMVYYGDPACTVRLVPNVNQQSGDLFCVQDDSVIPAVVVWTFTSTTVVFGAGRYWEKTTAGCELRSGAPASFPAGFYLVAG